MVVSEGDGAHAIDVERGVRPVVDAKIDVTGCVAGAPRHDPPRPMATTPGTAARPSAIRAARATARSRVDVPAGSDVMRTASLTLSLREGLRPVQRRPYSGTHQVAVRPRGSTSGGSSRYRHVAARVTRLTVLPLIPTMRDVQAERLSSTQPGEVHVRVALFGRWTVLVRGAGRGATEWLPGRVLGVAAFAVVQARSGVEDLVLCRQDAPT